MRYSALAATAASGWYARHLYRSVFPLRQSVGRKSRRGQIASLYVQDLDPDAALLSEHLRQPRRGWLLAPGGPLTPAFVRQLQEALKHIHDQ
jgi:hypothetical protein